MPSESLTPDLTMLCIGWVQAGSAWALRVPSFHMCSKSAYCPFVCRGLEACLHSLPSVFFDLLCGLLFDFLLLLGAGPYLMMDLIFLWPTSWFSSFLAILYCYSCCSDSILLGLFRPAVYSFPQWLGMATGFSYLWAPASLLSFFWASLAHLLSLGFLGPFTNSAFPWAFTNFIGLPWPNYLILILGVHGSAINPLLS